MSDSESEHNNDGAILSVCELSLETLEAKISVVDNVSFDIHRSEILGLIGESGSGKTSLALAVMGLLTHTQIAVRHGSIMFRGVDLLRLSERDMSRRRGAALSIVFQEPLSSLNPLVCCGAQVEDPLRFHTDLGRKLRREQVYEAFQLVGLEDPERIYAAFPRELSGGQRQRILFAMAMIMKPKLLICDEPTTALDAPVKAQILSLISDLRDQTGVSVLLISHDLRLISNCADRVVVLDNGRVIESGVTADMLARRSFGEEQSEKLFRGAEVGRPSDNMDAPLVSATGLVKRYETGHKWVIALDAISLQVSERESVGIVGESGSGKTTLARCLCGLTAPEEGRMVFGGREVVSKFSKRHGTDSIVQMVFQDPLSSLNPTMRVGYAIGEGLRTRGIREKEVRASSMAMLQQVGLDDGYFSRYPAELSGGERQRIAIARALIVGPALLIADEPVSSLDSSVQSQVVELLAQLRRTLGMSLLIISHDLNVVRRLCDRVLVMRAGKIVEEGTTDDILAEPRNPYTKRLVIAVKELSPGANQPRDPLPDRT